MALRFRGYPDSVDVGSAAALQQPAATLTCWLNPVSLSNAYSGVIAVGGTYGNKLYIKSNGKLASYNDATNIDGAGSHTLSVGTWYHIAVTYSSAAGMVLYVNGEIDATTGGAGPLNSPGGSEFYLGTDTTDLVNRTLTGLMADAAIYSNALSASSIALLASGLSPLAVSPQTLSGYWPLRGSQPVVDRGPNGLLGFMTGSPSPEVDPPFLMPSRRRVFAPSTYGYPDPPAEGEWPALNAPSAAGAAAFGRLRRTGDRLALNQLSLPKLPRDGLAAYWPLSYEHLDTTAGKAADISGVGFPLTGNGGFVRSLLRDTVTGGGVNFDGATTLTAATAVITNASAGPYTLSCWVNLSSVVGAQYFFAQGLSGGSDTALGFRADVSNKFIFTADGSGSYAASDVAATTGRLYFLAGVVYANGAGNTVLFVDGVRQSFTGGNSVSASDTTAIGSSTSGGATTSGLIYECRAYKRALSDSEVFVLYQHGLRGIRERIDRDDEGEWAAGPATAGAVVVPPPPAFGATLPMLGVG